MLRGHDLAFVVDPCCINKTELKKSNCKPSEVKMSLHTGANHCFICYFPCMWSALLVVLINCQSHDEALLPIKEEAVVILLYLE